MQEYFETQPIHCQGNCDITITNSGVLYTIGSDDMIYQKNIKTSEEKREYLDASDGSYVTIAASDSQPNNVVIGGLGKTLQSVSNMNKEEISHLYKFSQQISQIVISKNGKYMAVASEEQSAGLYNFQSKKMVKCRPQHSQSVLSVFFSNNESYVCSTGTDGILRIYSLEDPELPALKFEYKISKDFNRKQNFQQILRGMFNPTDSIIACPGKPFLQLIQCHKDLFHETYKMGIKHGKQITICHWQNDQILITGGLDVTVKIWNYYGEEEIVKIQSIYFTKIITFQKTFFGINHSGTVYKFTQEDKIAAKKQQIKNSRQIDEKSDQIQILGPLNPDVIEDDEEGEDIQRRDRQDDHFPKRGSKSKADKIIKCYPQNAIVTSTQFFSNNRYLLYNTIGCVVERTDGVNNSIQVQYHDSKIINKRKSIFTDREMKYFDLQINRVAYANETEYGFFGDCFWEHKVEQEEQILGVSLGNEWMAVALEGSILIFDLAGNFMNSISFDKSFVAMAAYQDMLVVVYVDSVPMWDCQNLRMNIWNINGVNETVENTFVAIRPSSTLKAFGFSEQGLIYAQDSKDWVRVYCPHSRQWVDIVNPKNPEGQSETKLWIVGMSGYQLFAFKLNQGEFEPTVLPRMYPRKIKLSIPNPHNRTKDQSYTNGNKGGFGEALWKKLVLEHQRYRYRTWYRYKFARGQTNPNYSKSATILSQQQLNIKQNALDADFIFLIKNFLINKEAQRAYITAKTFIKSERQLKKIMQVFTESELPQFAQKLQEHYDESARLQQYDLAQKLKLKQLQQDMEMAINFKPIDPMNPNSHKYETKATKIHSIRRMDSQAAADPLKQFLLIEQGKVEDKNQNQDFNYNPFSRPKDPLQNQERIKKQMDNRMQKAILKQQEKKRPTMSISDRQPSKR